MRQPKPRISSNLFRCAVKGCGFEAIHTHTQENVTFATCGVHAALGTHFLKSRLTITGEIIL